MEKTPHVHWRALSNPDYIGAYSLDGKDLTVKILSVNKREVVGDKGKKDMCTVAELEGQKPMVVNATNSKMIQKILGTAYIDEWVGKSITLYPTTTKDKNGEMVECIRVRPVAPKTRANPTLNPLHPKWPEAVAYIQKGGKVEKLLESYTISPEDQDKLKGATA